MLDALQTRGCSRIFPIMQDELDRAVELAAVSSPRPGVPAHLEMLDVPGAIALAEKFAESRILGDVRENGDLALAIAEASASAEKNERMAVVAPAERLVSVRDGMRRAASARLGMVAHAIGGHGAEELSALTDLGWGVLCAAGPEDSFDLTLVARRAAEDSGVPFIVVHGLGRASHPAGRAIAMVGLPEDRKIEAFVGPAARARSKMDAARASASDRTFAERVPFALGAALREYGSVSGRRHDAFDKIPLGESPLVLVGMGPVGDALFCTTNALRARGYDVGAVRITSLRPFPGQRLVKALARALAITVLEPADEPLAHGGLLARDVKSAFTDALTWMPGFPGIGRIPKLFVGATGPEFDFSDLVAACDNMLADERGRRVFSFLDIEHALPRRAEAVESSREQWPEREVAMRFVLDDVASADAVLKGVGVVLANGVGLRAHGIVTATTPGAGVLVDIVASRDHARGGMARRAPRLVIATEHGVSSAGAVVPLPENSVLGVLGSDPTSVLPEAARSVVRERNARVVPLVLGDGGAAPNVLVAVVAGAALAAACRTLTISLDGGAVARIVGESVSAADEASALRARRAFEATRDILTAASEPDATGIRMKPVGFA